MSGGFEVVTELYVFPALETVLEVLVDPTEKLKAVKDFHDDLLEGLSWNLQNVVHQILFELILSGQGT